MCCKTQVASRAGCLCDGSRLEAHDFFVKELFELFATDVVLVQIELEEVGVERRGDGLIIRVMLCQIG